MCSNPRVQGSLRRIAGAAAARTFTTASLAAAPKLFLALTLALSLVSCSSPFNDRPRREEQLSIGSSESQCLSTAPQVVQRYFDGRSSEQEIGGFWDCSARALDLFTNHTRGKTADAYSADELRRFLERFFLGKQKIQDALLAEGMKFKNSILGGGDNTLTVEEIRFTIDIIRVLKAQSVKLLPFQPLRPSHMKELGVESVDRAASDLVSAAEEIGRALRRHANEYSFDDMQRLLRQVDLFLSSAGVEVREIRVVSELIPIIRSLKSILVSRPAESISSEDWSRILVTGTRWYALVLKLAHLTGKYGVVMWGEGFHRMRALIAEAKSLLNASLATWPGSTVPFSELNTLVDAMGDKRVGEWLREGVTAETVKKTLQPVVQRLMGGTELGATGRAAEGLSAGAVERTWREFERFAEGQDFLERLFDRLAGKGSWSTSQAFSPEELLGRASEIVPQGPLAAEASTDMKYMIQWYRPLFLGDDNQVFYYPSTYDRRHSFHNLFQMNWMRAVSRVFISGYADDVQEGLSRAKSVGGLTQAEFYNIYSDLYDLGVQLKIFDKRVRNAGVKRFMEANLFSFQADGGTMLSLDEMIQMFAFLMSGTALAEQIHAELAAICPNGGQDIYGQPLIEAKCYREKFFDPDERRMERYWDHMPVMASFYRNLDADDKKAFEEFLEYAVRGDRKSSPMFESDDSKAMATIVHYVEAVFSRYDLDQSSRLSKTESNKAYPVFEGTLREASGITKPKRLKNLFTYLLKHGRKPDPDCFRDKVSFVWWAIQGPFQYFRADRTKVLQILATLSEAQSPAAQPGDDAGGKKKNCKRRPRN